MRAVQEKVTDANTKAIIVFSMGITTLKVKKNKKKLWKDIKRHLLCTFLIVKNCGVNIFGLQR